MSASMVRNDEKKFWHKTLSWTFSSHFCMNFHLMSLLFVMFVSLFVNNYFFSLQIFFFFTLVLSLENIFCLNDKVSSSLESVFLLSLCLIVWVNCLLCVLFHVNFLLQLSSFFCLLLLLLFILFVLSLLSFSSTVRIFC